MMHDPNDEEWLEDGSHSPAQPLNWVARLRRLVLQHWQPRKVEAPKVDPELPKLTGIERSAEVFRYSCLSLEYWLSPKGWLREWLRFNGKVASILAVPCLLIIPIITFMLGQFNTWSALLAQTTANLVLFPMAVLAIIGLVSGVVYLTRALSRPRRRHTGYYE